VVQSVPGTNLARPVTPHLTAGRSGRRDPGGGRRAHCAMPSKRPNGAAHDCAMASGRPNDGAHDCAMPSGRPNDGARGCAAPTSGPNDAMQIASPRSGESRPALRRTCSSADARTRSHCSPALASTSNVGRPTFDVGARAGAPVHDDDLKRPVMRAHGWPKFRCPRGAFSHWLPPSGAAPSAEPHNAHTHQNRRPLLRRSCTSRKARALTGVAGSRALRARGGAGVS